MTAGDLAAIAGVFIALLGVLHTWISSVAGIPQPKPERMGNTIRFTMVGDNQERWTIRYVKIKGSAGVRFKEAIPDPALDGAGTYVPGGDLGRKLVNPTQSAYLLDGADDSPLQLTIYWANSLARLLTLKRMTFIIPAWG